MKKLKQPQIILIVIVAIAIIAMAAVSIRHRRLSRLEAERIAMNMDTIPEFKHVEGNGVYYWKTVLSLDGIERDYIRKRKIDRAYVRFFDVVDTSDEYLQG